MYFLNVDKSLKSFSRFFFFWIYVNEKSKKLHAFGILSASAGRLNVGSS